MNINRSASSASMAKSTRACPPQSSPSSSSSKPTTPRNLSTYISIPPAAQSQQVRPHQTLQFHPPPNIVPNNSPSHPSRPRNLRHNDLHRLPRKHNLRRPSRLNGLTPAMRRPSRETILSPAQFDHDPPALGRLLRSSDRYRDSCEGDSACARAAQSDLSAPSDG